AIACYDRLLAAGPDDSRVRSNRASALKSGGRLREAVAEFDIVLAGTPHDPNALLNRGNAYLDLRRPEAAIPDLRPALPLRRQHHKPITPSPMFALNFTTEATAESHQAERSRWASRFGQSPNREHPNEPNVDRRLRIGYVSSYFRHQSATYAFGGVIVHHDP